MNKQYTTKEVGELVSRMLPEFGTEAQHYCVITPKGKTVWQLSATGWNIPAICETVPALTFTDVLTAIELLGEKRGWEDVPCDVSDTTMCPGARVEQYRYFTTYLSANKDMSDPKVTEYLLDLFEEG